MAILWHAEVSVFVSSLQVIAHIRTVIFQFGWVSFFDDARSKICYSLWGSFSRLPIFLEFQTDSLKIKAGHDANYRREHWWSQTDAEVGRTLKNWRRLSLTAQASHFIIKTITMTTLCCEDVNIIAQQLVLYPRICSYMEAEEGKCRKMLCSTKNRAKYHRQCRRWNQVLHRGKGFEFGYTATVLDCQIDPEHYFASYSIKR